MLRFCILVGFFIVCGCQNEKSKAKRINELVSKEEATIDWQNVDQFPLFSGCEENEDKNAQRECFTIKLMQHFKMALRDVQYQVESDMDETVNVDFLIDQHGFISIYQIDRNEKVERLIPNFKEEVSKRLNDLTTVRPALKRGVPVKVSIRLPLVLNNKN